MKVEKSKYLVKVKPLLKELLGKLLEKYQYASILAQDSASKLYSISRSGISVSEDDLYSKRGFVARVYDNKAYYEYSFNEITPDCVDRIVSSISRGLVDSGSKLPKIFENSNYLGMEDEEVSFSKATEYEVDPFELGDEKIIEKLSKIREKGLAYSEKLVDFRVRLAVQKYTKIFLSKNKDLEQSVMWTDCTGVALASKGESIKNTFKSFSKLGGAEILEELEKDVEDVSKVAIELLDSEQIPPGTYDCVCDSTVTGLIVHEAFGHGVEMDMFVKNRAQAKEFMNKYVASKLVTMHDGAVACENTGSYFFDDDGVIAKDTIVIDKGILKSGICDGLSALCLNVKPTGNGRRESFERKAYTRMTNTFFEAGKDKVEDMIKSIEYGFLLENAMGGMEDPKNWGIQCFVGTAREIKNGKLTGKLYSQAIITGYVPDLLKSISMVSDGMEYEGGGACGKGHKEWVKVSDGGPYIKAKIRLG